MSADVQRFGPFELDSENFELRRGGHRVKLDRTALELLIVLAKEPGKLITHQHAVDQAWGKEIFIEVESAVYTAIRKIRRALGDNSGRPKFVQTVSRKGYRFIAPVTTQGTPGRKAEREAKRVILAVLPLENLSGDPNQEYFSDGLTEELTTALGRLSPQKLGVIARTSVMRYKGARKNIPGIARELGTDYVIEGSARRERGRVRIAVQLIRVADQTHIWTESFERPLGDILRVQAEVAEAAARKIQLTLVPSLPPSSPVVPEAYDFYLRARYLWDQRTAPALRGAIGYFEKALEHDPRYAPAWAGLSNCFAALALTSDERPRESFPRAAEAASKALALDASLCEAHIASGLVHFWFNWNWIAAEQEFRRAAELDPSNSNAHMFLAHLHSNLGRHEEAILEIRSARQLDPLSRIVNTHEGHFLYNARRYDEAAAPLKRVLELAPRFWIAHLVLGKLFGVCQLYEEALAEFAKSHRYSYSNTEPAALLGYTLGMSGHKAKARRALRELEQQARKRYLPPLHRSLVWMGLAEHAAALEALEEALQERDVRLAFLAVEPRWDPLRTQVQFEKLCKRVGFPKGVAENCARA
ncbi:MAG TPA: winged helix-turn-helix domain-containing protein [Candidatus Acidoferrum sp.]|nr:winged helix-turn-helix domain-containing protein [Candidatus Acidoferrum sp.]